MTTTEQRFPPLGTLSIDDAIDFSNVTIRTPRLPAGSVTRRQLIQRLQGAREADVITVVAPAGYGKTTLLAQWVESEPRPVAWLTLTRADNDESTLLSHLGLSLARAGLLDADVASSLRFGSPLSRADGLSRIAWGLSDSQSEGILVIDQAEAVKRQAAKSIVKDIAGNFNGRLQLVVASRSSTVIPVAKLRTKGRILELGEAELKLDINEARELLEARGLRSGLASETLIERSEGWPVALSLLAMAAGSEADFDPTLHARGDDRYLAEYFTSEILAKLSPARREFLIRTSFLDVLTGKLCDAVLQRDDSEKTLRLIAEKTSLIHPIDRPSIWYSTNGLLRAGLKMELERRYPASLPQLYGRAAQWYEDNNMPATAIAHAHAAGDTERFTRMLGQLIRSEYVLGQAPSVLQWMAWFEAEAPLGAYPEITAVGALIHALEGDGLETDRWFSASAPVGSGKGDVLPVTLLVRALGTKHGVEAMIADAIEAREKMEAGSLWVPATFLAEGMGHLWNGDVVTADSRLAEAVALGREAESLLTIVVALAERTSIAISQGEWDRANHLVSESLRIIEEHGLETYSTSGLAFAMAARIARRKGDLVNAKLFLGKGSSSRARLGTSIPGLALQTFVEMAKACVELADAAGARVLLRDARDIVLQRPNLGQLTEQLYDLEVTLRHFGSGSAGPSALTKAELRLLPLLASHLTFVEIGDRLFVSKHTVKSQATSIYRKLGTSNRSEAVARARETGLLQG